MDQLQNALKDLLKNYQEALNDRTQLKALLSDYLPQNKMQQNILLNAYDEGIVSKLLYEQDATLFAIRMIKQLQNDYAMTQQAAFWTVETWCYIVGKTDVLDALDFVKPNSPSDSIPDQPKVKLHLAEGIYMAGYDFPEGYIKIEVTSLIENDQAKRQGVYYAIKKKDSTSIVENGTIKGHAILKMKQGQRLEIGWQGEVDLVSINPLNDSYRPAE